MNGEKHSDDIGDCEIPIVAAIPAPWSRDEGENDHSIRAFPCEENSEAQATLVSMQVRATDPIQAPHITSEEQSTPARSVSSVVAGSTVTTAADVSGTDMPSMTELHQPTQIDSPSISAIATPEPTRQLPQQQQQQQQQGEGEPLPPLSMDQLNSPAPSMVVTDEQQELPHVQGHWRTSLCSCWDASCTSLPWMACCCTSIVLGQIMTRLRLDWCGREHPEASVRTFGIVVSLTFTYLVLCALGVGVVIVPAFVIWVCVLAIRLRQLFRTRYSISAKVCCPQSCHGAMEDICISICCLCCSVVQMARHTHDEKRHPYELFSPTGLPSYAPEIPKSHSMEERQ